MARGWFVVLLLVAGMLLAQGPWLREAGEPAAGHAPGTAQRAPDAGLPDRGGLPPEAYQTLRLIDSRGPFPYDRDGTVFQNREGLLPSRPRGYYREYTVPTPGSPDRGARRIVAGGDPPEVIFYSDDHYRSFQRIEAATR